MNPTVPCRSIGALSASYPFDQEHSSGFLGGVAYDGGGIRGIISGIVSEELEKRSGRRIAGLFQIVAGTSTGAINAGALTVPKESGQLEPKFTARDIVELYRVKGPQIFPADPYWKKPFTWLRDTCESQYSAATLGNVLAEFCGATLMGDAVAELLIPALEITEMKPWYFQRKICRIDPAFSNLALAKVVRASTAAPTFFDPQPITFHGRQYAFADGGLFDNNPSDALYVAAKKTWAKADEKLVLVSIGTGVAPEKIPYSSASGWGEIKWAPKITDVFTQSGAEKVHEQMQELLPSSGDEQRYFRFQTILDKEHASMDDASQWNLSYLEEKGKEIIENQDEEIRKVCKLLAPDSF